MLPTDVMHGVGLIENCAERIEGANDGPRTRIANKEFGKLPSLRELQCLRENAAGIDFEKTIANMFEIIQSMESQLSHVLNINTVMERELVGAKERITDLKQQRDQLLEEISRIKEETPSKRELQMVIDQLFEERNNAEQRLRDFKRVANQTTGVLQGKDERIIELVSERKDLIAEIHFLETRLTVALDRTKQVEERLIVLDGQAIASRERIQELERDLQLAIEEKLKSSRMLRESQRVVAELHVRSKEA